MSSFAFVPRVKSQRRVSGTRGAVDLRTKRRAARSLSRKSTIADVESLMAQAQQIISEVETAESEYEFERALSALWELVYPAKELYFGTEAYNEFGEPYLVPDPAAEQARQEFIDWINQEVDRLEELPRPSTPI